jgi:O-acetyl-ADP-ribose deacetylase (regulator of RNase III)
VEVVAAAPAAVAGLVNEGADDVDAEPANAALVRRLRQIRPAESERIEGPAIVDEAYTKAARPPPERHRDSSCH